ncbi:MAG: Rrf2 family transcriptional regulator [Deltaproteobacteria bacterium]|nr:Rrf2 family transcriptional regulator [Deltaproteobacteria bacterium]
MRITRETDYAVRCVLFLSGRPETKASVAEIAGTMEIPSSFLPKIVQKLAREKLVESSRGVGGGVHLLKKPAEISLYDVINCIEDGGVGLNDCVIKERGCHRSPFCTVHPVWLAIQEVVKEQLKSYTFDNLLHSSRATGLDAFPFPE